MFEITTRPPNSFIYNHHNNNNNNNTTTNSSVSSNINTQPRRSTNNQVVNIKQRSSSLQQNNNNNDLYENSANFNLNSTSNTSSSNPIGNNNSTRFTNTAHYLVTPKSPALPHMPLPLNNASTNGNFVTRVLQHSNNNPNSYRNLTSSSVSYLKPNEYGSSANSNFNNDYTSSHNNFSQDNDSHLGSLSDFAINKKHLAKATNGNSLKSSTVTILPVYYETSEASMKTKLPLIKTNGSISNSASDGVGSALSAVSSPHHHHQGEYSNNSNTGNNYNMNNNPNSSVSYHNSQSSPTKKSNSTTYSIPINNQLFYSSRGENPSNASEQSNYSVYEVPVKIPAKQVSLIKGIKARDDMLNDRQIGLTLNGLNTNTSSSYSSPVRYISSTNAILNSNNNSNSSYTSQSPRLVAYEAENNSNTANRDFSRYVVTNPTSSNSNNGSFNSYDNKYAHEQNNIYYIPTYSSSNNNNNNGHSHQTNLITLPTLFRNSMGNLNGKGSYEGYNGNTTPTKPKGAQKSILVNKNRFANPPNIPNTPNMPKKTVTFAN
jgi:hypothetical protein